MMTVWQRVVLFFLFFNTFLLFKSSLGSGGVGGGSGGQAGGGESSDGRGQRGHPALDYPNTDPRGIDQGNAGSGGGGGGGGGGWTAPTGGFGLGFGSFGIKASVVLQESNTSLPARLASFGPRPGSRAEYGLAGNLWPMAWVQPDDPFACTPEVKKRPSRKKRRSIDNEIAIVREKVTGAAETLLADVDAFFREIDLESPDWEPLHYLQAPIAEVRLTEGLVPIERISALSKTPNDRPKQWIALIARGTCQFVEKVLNAQELGAVGVVIGDPEREGVVTMYAQSDIADDVTIPSVFVGKSVWHDLNVAARRRREHDDRDDVYDDLSDFDMEEDSAAKVAGVPVIILAASLTGLPFLDSLLVILLSPLLAMAGLLVIYRIRAVRKHRNEIAPKSVVEGLPVFVWRGILPASGTAAAAAAVATPAPAVAAVLSSTTDLEAGQVVKADHPTTTTTTTPSSRTTALLEPVVAKSDVSELTNQVHESDEIVTTSRPSRLQSIWSLFRRPGRAGLGQRLRSSPSQELLLADVSVPTYSTAASSSASSPRVDDLPTPPSPSHMKHLSIPTFAAPTECAICLDDFSDGDRVRVLPCRHLFHADCVDAWLIERKRVCPCCKHDITVPSLERVQPATAAAVAAAAVQHEMGDRREPEPGEPTEETALIRTV